MAAWFDRRSNALARPRKSRTVSARDAILNSQPPIDTMATHSIGDHNIMASADSI